MAPLTIHSIKRKGRKGWDDIPLDRFADITFRDLFSQFDGQEVVAEGTFAGHSFYFCGTEQWKQRMKIKGGRACLFSEALADLASLNTTVLDHLIGGGAKQENQMELL
jgi:hypothetical protein